MINRTISNDLSPSFRHTDFGYFAAPVMVQAEPSKLVESVARGGEAQESTNRTERANSCGGRSIQFAGGGTSGRGLGTVPDKRGLNSVVGSERLTGPASIKRKGRGGGRW